MTQRVLVDANVLFSKTTMDWLFLLRQHNPGMFTLCTTEDILAEVLANMRKAKPGAPGHYTRRRAELIRDSVDEIIGDFPAGLPFTGTDPKDYHVHAAAVTGGADILLTMNGASDFTEDPDAEDYEIYDPDDFFVLIADSCPASIITVTKEQLDYWSGKPDYVQLDEVLQRAGCMSFSQYVTDALQYLALCAEA